MDATTAQIKILNLYAIGVLLLDEGLYEEFVKGFVQYMRLFMSPKDEVEARMLFLFNVLITNVVEQTPNAIERARSVLVFLRGESLKQIEADVVEMLAEAKRSE